MADELKLLSPQEFPPLLREISDPPKQLHLRGKMPSTDHKWLAVVGSRAMTTYGKQAVRHLIEGLRGYPVVIVSASHTAWMRNRTERHSRPASPRLRSLGLDLTGMSYTQKQTWGSRARY